MESDSGRLLVSHNRPESVWVAVVVFQGRNAALWLALLASGLARPQGQHACIGAIGLGPGAPLRLMMLPVTA